MIEANVELIKLSWLTSKEETKKNLPIYQNLSDSTLGIVCHDFFYWQ